MPEVSQDRLKLYQQGQGSSPPLIMLLFNTYINEIGKMFDQVRKSSLTTLSSKELITQY